GRLAEEIFLSTRTTGAGSDIEHATELARKMVCEWGMSENMGPLTFGKKDEQIFLGRELAQHKDYSESTAILIDREVKRIVSECYEQARKIILDRRDVLEKLAAALLEREVLEGGQIKLITQGEDLPPMKRAAAPAAEKPPSKGSEEKVRRPASGPPLP